MGLFDSATDWIKDQFDSGSTSGQQQGSPQGGGTDYTPFILGLEGAGAIGDAYAAYKNYKMSKKQLEWDKDRQKIAWLREDNAVFRRTQDLRNAGLNPVLAAGQSAGNGPIVSSKAPEMNFNFQEKAQMMLNAIRMKEEIANTLAQRKLMASQQNLADAQAGIKWHDYKLFKASNTPSNAGGLASTIRSIYGMSQSPIVDQLKNEIKDNVEKIRQNSQTPSKVQKYLVPQGTFGIPGIDWERMKREDPALYHQLKK